MRKKRKRVKWDSSISPSIENEPLRKKRKTTELTENSIQQLKQDLDFCMKEHLVSPILSRLKLLRRESHLAAFMTQTGYHCLIYDWALKHKEADLIQRLLNHLIPDIANAMVSREGHASLKDFITTNLKNTDPNENPSASVIKILNIFLKKESPKVTRVIIACLNDPALDRRVVNSIFSTPIASHEADSGKKHIPKKLCFLDNMAVRPTSTQDNRPGTFSTITAKVG